MSHAPKASLSLRAVTAEDESFLRALYAETRAREMEATSWPVAARVAFLNGQFDAQQRSYRTQYPEGSFDVVLAAGKPVGRLYVARSPKALHVVDITLAASCRGRGWGTMLLERIIAEAEGREVPVRLHVDNGNRARRLYGRLGFREMGREGLYLRMERPVPRCEQG